ncbi:endonuclease domain-containing protein [Sphingomonas sp. CV7422]|uniref:endonuclease domain-containing protein n=1 Tax=Sphingomonas sp. CV7422 TaxID=3018036 RepID=UPI0022FDBDF3|nr:endonuclease domain-containing protein [Sphingomonas sp. CV7422]
MPQTPRFEVARARRLRREMSLPEVLLWQQLRRQQRQLRFRRQHPIGPYAADFFCAERKLVIEVDGEAHGRGDRPGRDAVRDSFMEENGYRVLRIGAVAILRDMDAVPTAIRAYAATPLHHSPAASGPPPRSGEE